ncbi:hypothetical protein VNO77_26886 [Canavalia gladiata]|uniref:Uncharacterized protein n=1 Tax=Canavalia gladiata TaxID=3824 RepID=A0AAN9KTU1_CANGL
MLDSTLTSCDFPAVSPLFVHTTTYNCHARAFQNLSNILFISAPLQISPKALESQSYNAKNLTSLNCGRPISKCIDHGNRACQLNFDPFPYWRSTLFLLSLRLSLPRAPLSMVQGPYSVICFLWLSLTHSTRDLGHNMVFTNLSNERKLLEFEEACSKLNAQADGRCELLDLRELGKKKVKCEVREHESF